MQLLQALVMVKDTMCHLVMYLYVASGLIHHHSIDVGMATVTIGVRMVIG